MFVVYEPLPYELLPYDVLQPLPYELRKYALRYELRASSPISLRPRMTPDRLLRDAHDVSSTQTLRPRRATVMLLTRRYLCWSLM